MIFKYASVLMSALVAVSAPAQRLDTLVNVGSYKLHFSVLVGKGPPILFESGGGQDAAQWDSIAPAVHCRLHATVITYDRAGFGKSTAAAANCTILQEINGLETALTHLGYNKDCYLLVGHSLGGFYNRVFAARHPAQVKGIVLLDPRIPSREDMKFARNYFRSLNRSDFETGYMNLYYLLANMERTSDYVRHVPLPTSIPLLDIMAETGPFADAKENKRFQADQRRLVKAAKNRRLLFAEGSSHNIPYDKPGLVIEQVVNFYDRHLND